MNFAPIKDPLTERSWLDWFASVGEALQGKWLRRVWAVDSTGITKQSESGFLVYQGSTLFVSIAYINAVFTSATITLPDQVEKGALTIHDITAGTQTTAIASGTTLTLPDLSSTNLIINGSLILAK